MKKAKFGRAFVDELAKISRTTKHFKQKEGFDNWKDFVFNGSQASFENTLLSPWKRVLFVLLYTFSVSALFIRLFHLQIVKGEYNLELADTNRIKIKTTHAPRGVIYDRNGKILAQNEPGFRFVNPIESESGKRYQYISRDEALKLEVNNNPKFNELEIDNLRAYPLGEKTAHILGYLSEITEDELKEQKFINYKSGDRIGRSGIEESYEKVLRGKDGGEIIEIDAQGKKLRTLRKVEPLPGQNLYLTIDASLQEQAAITLEENIKKSKSCCAALIVSNPNNGQILALISSPSYNPNDLTPALTDPNSPLLNRVIGGVYPPGSTFKIASSLAGLASGKITAETRFEDTGVLNLGPFSFSNWFFTQYGRKEAGLLDMTRALQRSNDIFYYRLGQLVGEKQIGETAKILGLGANSGIDIPGEVSGTIPGNDWKVENFNEVWYPGDTLHLAIGQGFITATPLQVNNLTSAIAARGSIYPPHLAYKITNLDNKTVKEFTFESPLKPGIKSEFIEIVKKGLELVPKPGGTAWPFFNFPIETAGKTGTAEFGDPKNRTHAWYTAYAPASGPQLVATVLIEAGGEGSTNASPVIKEIFRWYFSEDKTNLIKDIYPSATQSAQRQAE